MNFSTKLTLILLVLYLLFEAYNAFKYLKRKAEEKALLKSKKTKQTWSVERPND